VENFILQLSKFEGPLDLLLASLLQTIDVIKVRTRHIIIKKVRSRLSIQDVMARIHDILQRCGSISVREAFGNRLQLWRSRDSLILF